MLLSILVAKSERVTGNLGQGRHSGPNRSLDSTVQGPAREPVGASAVVSHRGTDPSLQIAQVPYELRALGPAHVLQLIRRLAQPVHAVADLLEAVFNGGALSRLQPAESGQLLHERFRRFRRVDAHGQRRRHQLRRVFVDCGGVRGKGFHAHGGVCGGSA